MTTRTLQILLALAEGPLHGYGIKQRVEERTDGEVRLGSGTLYEAVHRLLEQGMLAEVAAPVGEATSGGPPRRFYALTADGRSKLAEELRRMDAVVRFARDRDLLPEGGGS
ncbi:MAG TPA: helix-turn-helix transcriptional regulator [Longimicrobiales bacterium]|nr:helix-turn-helix transcriptional regulator [Longimicrobiales bacterium]